MEGGGLKLADRVHPVSEFSQLNQVGPGKVAGGRTRDSSFLQK